ncbi:MAG: hypothetical protein JSV18_00670 [Candidatus Bathyarchaeota archaeon]|nr:MAG: hypothetical protein JSV18_00670 [Candidatus Bathyarchaeota archaeon]
MVKRAPTKTSWIDRKGFLKIMDLRGKIGKSFSGAISRHHCFYGKKPPYL